MSDLVDRIGGWSGRCGAWQRGAARRWSGGGSWVVRRLVVGSDDGGGVVFGGWRWCGGRWSDVGDGMMMVVRTFQEAISHNEVQQLGGARRRAYAIDGGI
ncbi:hypothetical protein Tco_1012065, partial [Tanacetum coccineum]